MKKILFYTITLLLSIGFNACQEDDLDPKSIFDKTEQERDDFDKWLLQNYTYPYNIEFKYRMEDIESSMNFNLVPATVENSKKMAKLVRHLWIDVYDEIAGIHFTREYIPKVIHLVGSAGWDTNNKVMGSAEDGMKVTLYGINDFTLNPQELNKSYFHVMHHEFAHILHQKKNFDTTFSQITEKDYIQGDWYTRDLDVVRKMGFVTQYAGSSPNEDFVEIIATYVLNTAEDWEAIVNSGGEEGSKIILNKYEIVRKYMKDVWKIDMDELRSIVKRRESEISLLDLDNL